MVTQGTEVNLRVIREPVVIKDDTNAVSTPRLFDDFARTDLGRASRLEAEYDRWNRSARREVAAVREELETWLARYPTRDAAALVHRFRSKSSDLHRSALFELFVHEQLVRAGFGVECHPAVPGARTRPDFRAHREGAPGFFVEAVSAGPSTAERRAELLKDAAIEVIDSMRSNEWFVSVLVCGAATRALPIRKTQLRERIAAWLGGLNHAQVLRRQRSEPFAERPALRWEAAGLSLELKVCAKDPSDASGRISRLLASETRPAVFVPPGHPMIEGALRRKAGRYGRLSAPYLVAINVLDAGVSHPNVSEALERVLGAHKNPKYRSVTGVLLATVSNPLSATKTSLKAVFNPRATHTVGANFPIPELTGSLAW